MAEPSVLLRRGSDLRTGSGAEPEFGIREQGAQRPDLRLRQRPASVQLRAEHGVGRPDLRRGRHPRAGPPVRLHVQRRGAEPAPQLHALA